MKVVIVGGVAGGMTTASQLRRLDEDIEIHVYEKGPNISFANCGLPYYLSREVTKREHLIERTPEDMLKRDIVAHTLSEVISVNTEEKFITVSDRQTGQTENVSYDKLVLSPGATSRMLEPLKNVKQAFVLQHLHHLDAIEDYIARHNTKEVVIIGGGYIGLEVVENFTKRGFKVTMLQHTDEIYGALESDMKDFMYEALEENNVELKLNAEITKVNGDTATLATGEEIYAPLIIVSVGIIPSTEFLKDSNVQLEKGYIPINEYGETNVKDVYALGDAVLTHYMHRPDIKVNIALAWPAHRLAYIIAQHINGNKEFKHDGLLGASVIQLFDYTIAQVGLSLKDLRDPYLTIDHTQASIARYLKNPEEITARVYADKNHQILRGVFVGKNGVDKRLDVLSTFMRADGNIKNLINIEVGYAPPYSSPKDLLNMIGYKAIGALED